MKYKDLVKAAFGLWYTRKDKSVAKLIINSMTREELDSMEKFILDINDYAQQFFKERGLTKDCGN